MLTVMIKYLRDEYRRPKAVFVAIAPGCVGYALCHKHDHFNKKKGRDIAYRRAVAAMQDYRQFDVPESIQPLYDRMIQLSNFIFSN